MSEQLEGLLAQFAERDLQRLVPPRLERDMGRLAGTAKADRRRWLAKCVVASQGESILRHPSARKGLLLLLDPEELAEATRTHLHKAFDRPEDNALALSRMRWGVGAPLVEYLANRFGLGYELLPRPSAVTPVIEEVALHPPLPPLHEHQEAVRAQVADALRKPGGSFLVQMPTGSGKTRTMVEAMTDVWGATLDKGSLVWLAHAEELCEQAADSIRRVWSAKAEKPTRIVRFFGTHAPPAYSVPGAIVVASLQKIYARIRARDPLVTAMRTTSRAVVVDEAHRALAPSFDAVIKELTASGAVLAGLSATPGRGIERPEENRALAELFGGRLVTPPNPTELVRSLQSRGILARLRRRLIETGVEVQPGAQELESVRLGFDYGQTVLQRLAANEQRNRLLLETIETEVAEGRPTIVFACSVGHAHTLSAALNLRGTRSGHVDGETLRGDRERTIDAFRGGDLEVLFNFGVLTTGFDAPRTRTVVVARPTTSAVLYGQMVGRALRGPAMGGGEESWVVDVCDNLVRFGSVTDVYNAFDDFWST